MSYDYEGQIVWIETLHIDDGRWWVTGHGGSIHFSTDDAATWEAVYLPPER